MKIFVQVRTPWCVVREDGPMVRYKRGQAHGALQERTVIDVGRGKSHPQIT